MAKFAQEKDVLTKMAQQAGKQDGHQIKSKDEQNSDLDSVPTK